MGKIKEKRLAEYMVAPHKVGDWVKVPETCFNSYGYDTKYKTAEVVEVIDDTHIKVRGLDYDYKKPVIVTIDKCQKDLYMVGSNPFPENNWRRNLETANYMLESILFCCGIEVKDDEFSKKDKYEIGGVLVPELNWNPYVYDKDGNKVYYQRDYCWTLKDEQLLIESIYQSINCGLVIVRKHSWDWVEKEIANGNTEVAFNDIVDGKQRMHTLARFVNDEFPDLHGNYYSDLSTQAQHFFMDSNAIQYATFSDKTTDDQIIQAFLNVNFTGVPMSQEHIDYVKEIQKKM